MADPMDDARVALMAASMARQMVDCSAVAMVLS